MTREEFGLVPKYSVGNVLVNDKGERIKIMAIVADQYMFDCGDEYPHYDFLDCIESQFTPIKKGE